MSKGKDRSSNSIPSWQSRKMRRLITERWSEVWQIVEARKENSAASRMTS
jgi:hypothetical protein